MTVQRLQSEVKKPRTADEFIDAPNPKRMGSEVKVTLRVPVELLDIVDKLRRDDMTKESRNTWILKAVKAHVQNMQ